MGKKKKAEKLNLKNPKQLKVIHTFAISEGRVTKEQILQDSNKEIMYRMKNNGYIKETVKGSGIYKATSKLQNLISKTEGKEFAVGCSNKHSATIKKSLSYIPESVIMEGRYASGQALKEEMTKYKKTTEYQKKINEMQRDVIRERKQIENRFQDRKINAKSNAEIYQAEIDFRSEIQENKMKEDIIFNDNVLFVPDYSVNMYRYEMEELYSNFESRVNELPGKEQQFMLQNMEKVEKMLRTGQKTYEVCFEIVTDSYGNREMQMHKNFEILMEKDVLYIC